jgi:alginate O-acetyltransferase complex protein AlgJ
MLSRYRRYIAVLGFLLLATPLVAGLVAPDGPEAILKEGRRIAPPPRAPESWEGLLALPDQIDAYLQDRFGLRQRMIRLHRDLTKPVLAKGNSAVLIGRDGRMFYQGDEMVRQSAGLTLRDERVSETVDMIASMRDALARRGIRFLVAVPPNSSTIYQDDLPLWAQNKGRPTEYDLFLQDLAAHGVMTVDLRPAVGAARARGPAYRMFDSHWTMRGAVAGFNAIAEADGHPNWRLDPASALGSLATLKGGDVARILGVDESVAESSEELALPAGKTEKLPPANSQDYVQTSETPGPTVMIVGDSFTMNFLAPMLAPHTGRVIWLHHQYCGFDWKWIDKLHPDEVWWMPTERFLVCKPGMRPLDFAG